ncbi:molybdenum cofactor biosynthesis protein A [Gottschalkia acidurici 9a]|uniref:GTP 3',8-cyclase n=1 Tax=Gottschalkia acidurici (strain ATCC 7906 / DSM 604 / BCRC 14475 / CIP 104303 / KCTC 5404 / NCIMB 10678 / 9a) TaxID=1128398 RepID=K0B4U0_GOTA9|nr:GTP 3',8-cyclase MoaA [Gottschalkia acidurici]AFS79890.1 molybdenum cofactor biosynthesis protein A [Gottschalkia acidurici 9a]
MKDLFGRNINYLRISVTDLCNLRCQYCMPQGGVCKVDHEDVLSIEEFYEIAKAFVSLGINKIRITGGEPLVKKGIVELVEKISKLDGVKDLAMTTNGIYLKDYAKQLKDAGLNRVNISLDTLNPEKYKEITRGGSLLKVLDGIEEAKKVGLTPIKINTVLIGDFNTDEIENFVYITKQEEIDVRFIELMPIGEASDWAAKKFVSNSMILDKVKELEKTEGNDPSSPAVYYKLPGGKGKVGIINPISCKFCDACNRVRLTSRGKLKLCLHSNDEIDLKNVLQSGRDLEKTIKEAILQKPEEHHLEEGKYIIRNMYEIGG